MKIQKILNKTKQFSVSFLESMNDKAIQVSDKDRANLKELDFELQHNQVDELEVIEKLNALVAPATMKMASSRFFGFVIGGSYPVSIAANWLGTIWDQNTGLEKTTPATAAYLPTENAGRNPSDYTPELSRRARGLDIYAVLHHLGQSGVEELVDRCCACAREFATAFTAAGYEVMNEVVMNQVVVNFGSDEVNLSILDAVQKEGTCWVGQTIWRGVTAMRISVSNWQTDSQDVRKSLAVILKIASKH